MDRGVLGIGLHVTMYMCVCGVYCPLRKPSHSTLSVKLFFTAHMAGWNHAWVKRSHLALATGSIYSKINQSWSMYIYIWYIYICVFHIYTTASPQRMTDARLKYCSLVRQKQFDVHLWTAVTRCNPSQARSTVVVVLVTGQVLVIYMVKF